MTDEGLGGLDRERQLGELCERFGDLGWEVPRILDGFEVCDDLYVEDLTQVRSPTWSAGRVVLLGDAAWRVTPIAGAGTSLALVGAYVLAAALAHLSPGAPPAAAFASYEEWMRPLVDDAQDLPPGVPRVANPRSRLGVALFRTGTRLAALRPVRAVTGRLTRGPDPERRLPEITGERR